MRELISLGILLVASIIATKLIFYKESFMVALRVSASFYFAFLLPGYFLMLYWSEKLSFAERLIIGAGASFGLIGIFSYYLGLFGINIRYHVFILPLLLCLLGYVFYQSKKGQGNDANIHSDPEAHQSAEPVDNQGSDAQAKKE